RGVTVIVSTAYMDEAERFDRLAFLREGRVLALDTPEALRESLGGRLLSVRAEPLREARTRLEGLAAVRRASVFGDLLHVVVDSADAERSGLAARLAEWGFGSVEVYPIEPSMEDVFIERLAAAEAGGPDGS
ncbi:MAG: DUF4162 domain-containing protein, partial [Gemmatimonadota bacterium]